MPFASPETSQFHTIRPQVVKQGSLSPSLTLEYLERKGGLSSDRAIADADLLHDEKIAHWQQWLRHAGIFKPDAPKGPIFQDFNLLATAAIASHGVALCPVEVCRREIENGDLIVLSSGSVLEDESYFMISKALRSASATAFCDWFLKTCSFRDCDRSLLIRWSRS